MTNQRQPLIAWKTGSFFLRLLLSYLLIPFVPPIILLFLEGLHQRPEPPGDILGVLVIYAVFGLAAMIALGTPLLALYIARRWTGFIPFMFGGEICAGSTAYVLAAGLRNSYLSLFFAFIGLLCGAVFRALLFGVRRHPANGVTEETFSKPPLTMRKNGERIASVVGLLVGAAFLILLYSLSNEYRTVVEKMGWKCLASSGNLNSGVHQLQTVELWFLKNPHYEMQATGPDLCTDIQASGQTYIEATFEVWGNRLKGLHGYMPQALAVASGRLNTSGLQMGGVRGITTSHGSYNSKDHPEAYRFPLEVFK